MQLLQHCSHTFEPKIDCEFSEFYMVQHWSVSCLSKHNNITIKWKEWEEKNSGYAKTITVKQDICLKFNIQPQNDVRTSQKSIVHNVWKINEPFPIVLNSNVNDLFEHLPYMEYWK